MRDLIDRQAAINFKVSHGINECGVLYVPYGEVKKYLEQLPSAQRTGRWIDDELMCKARCSVCGEEFSWMDNDMDRFWFCPNCGAKMEETDERT